MATHGRGSETREAPPARPPFVPQMGRKYAQLVNRETGRVELVLLDDWERMEKAEGRQRYSPLKCSFCGGLIVKQCFARDHMGVRYLETCPHIDGLNNSGG